MRYKLIKPLHVEPFMTTFGGITYVLDTKEYREYPQVILSLYKDWLEAEPEAKPKPVKIKSEDNE